ncbi:MAG: glycogen debranching enzyme N-terminal domain-containing protein, partial [Proteobacteria bacterium]|nr:glycogen debranching enzyme N-terminal domain-containing protein [Pseudomonadota bacterium]
MNELHAEWLAAKPAEWIEPDGLGGFASGTVSGVRTRRYHALLLTARRPPTDRFVLVNGFDAWLETPSGSFALSSQAYGRDVVSPDGATRIGSFAREPWPQWTFQLPDGTRIEQQIFVPHGASAVAILWQLVDPTPLALLRVRPFLSGRDYHALQHETGAFGFAPERRDGHLVWHPYDGVPGVIAHSNGDYAHAPLWYRDFRYDDELARGLDGREDLAAPGELRFDLAAGEAVLLFAAEGHEAVIGAAGERPADAAARLRHSERERRASFASPRARAADAYVVKRGDGRTLVAGYPWFTDWGRDTLIALRGLCLATGRLDVARMILLEWAASVSEGMLPNRFPDRGEKPEFNAVDASLWFVIAVSEWIAAAERAGFSVAFEESWRLESAVDAILACYEKGTRFGIRADADGLLAAGAPGVQLTWMDAKIGDWVVTPRSGKPVEVQALWINALLLAGARSAHWRALAQRAMTSFEARFWDDERGFLADVVDVDHEPGRVDASFRPNQIFAVGGLPFAL